MLSLLFYALLEHGKLAKRYFLRTLRVETLRDLMQLLPCLFDPPLVLLLAREQITALIESLLLFRAEFEAKILHALIHQINHLLLRDALWILRWRITFLNFIKLQVKLIKAFGACGSELFKFVVESLVIGLQTYKPLRRFLHLRVERPLLTL